MVRDINLYEACIKGKVTIEAKPNRVKADRTI